MTAHQLRADGNGINVAGWEGASDSLVAKEMQLVSITFTAMTSPTGQINVPTTPIAALGRQLDYLGNLTVNYGITILDASNSTTYYPVSVDPSVGIMTVVTTQGGSTTVNSTNVKVTYFYLAPVSGTQNADGTVSPNVYIQSNIIVPTDSQSRLQNTFQTHNAVSVALSGSSTGSWIDTNGYDRVGVTFLNDAATSSTFVIQWSNDGSTAHGYETIWSAQTGQTNQGETAIKSRYFRVVLFNNDATLAHTMSAWAYCKV